MASKPSLIRSERALRQRVAARRKKGDSIALVPTMGALHDGHLSLVRRATSMADRTIVTIFVNPTQFGANEDLDRYPRDEASDLRDLGEYGVDLVFAPPVDLMYPENFATTVSLEGPATAGLEDRFRPHFFAGVATVVAKLLILCAPDIAIFGEKDFQQLLVIRQMAKDLNIPVKIEGAPTIREPDGLAMSSRNQYLTPGQRLIAPMLYAVLKDCALKMGRGASVNRTLGAGKTKLGRSGFRLDYLEARDSITLAPLDKKSKGEIRLIVAGWLGDTRLIDNIPAKISKFR